MPNKEKVAILPIRPSYIPTEDAAIRVIDEANNRLKEIVHIYDGKFLFGDRNKNQSQI